MKLDDIQQESDILRYIEGCLNDFEAGISTKEETAELLADLVIYIVNKAYEKQKSSTH